MKISFFFLFFFFFFESGYRIALVRWTRRQQGELIDGSFAMAATRVPGTWCVGRVQGCCVDGTGFEEVQEVTHCFDSVLGFV
jgi:hypothetical protein